MPNRLSRSVGLAVLLLPLILRAQDSPDVRADRFGDPLPEGAVTRLGTLRFRQPGWVHAVAFSPDRRAIATGSYEDSMVIVWNGKTGEVLRKIDLPEGNQVGSLAFSPDGKTLSVGGNGTIFLYAMAEAGKPETIDLHTGRAMMDSFPDVHHLLYSPDGKSIASVDFEGGIRIWDARSGERVRRIEADIGYASSLAFSPDGKVLVAGCQGMAIRGWETGSGKEVLTIEVPEPPVDPNLGQFNSEPEVGPIAFSGDGMAIASVGTDCYPMQTKVHLWDPETGKEMGSLGTGNHGYSSVAFSSDGTLLAAGGYRKVEIWNWREEKLLKTFPSGASHLAFGPEGRTIAGVGEMGGTILVREIESGEKVPDFEAHDAFVEALAYSPDGSRIASGDVEGVIILWDPETGRAVRHLRGPVPEAGIEDMEFSPDGLRLLVLEGNHYRVWDTVKGEAVLSIRAGGAWNPLDFSGPLGEGIQADVLRQFEGIAMAFSFSPDGKVASTAHADGSMQIWDCTSGKSIRKIDACESALRGIAFLEDGKRVVSCGMGGEIGIWDVASGRKIREGALPSGGVRCAALSPDGRLLVWGDRDGEIGFWDLEAGVEVDRLGRHEEGVREVRFSPDGKWLLSRGCSPSMASPEDEEFEFIEKFAMFKVWDLGLATEVLALKAYSDWTSSDMDEESVYHSVAFGPDGHTLVAGSMAGDVHIIQIATGKSCRRLSGHTGIVNDLACSPDGRFLASASYDTTILVWDAGPPSPPPTEGERRDPDTLWEILAGRDPKAAYVAMKQMTAQGDPAASCIRERLRPAKDENRERIRELIRRLDADDFRDREEASAALETLGEEAEPALRAALAQSPSPETEKRIRHLLERFDPPHDTFPNAQLQAQRAIRVLERIGSPEALRHLRDLSGGSSWASRTGAAAAAMRRLGISSPREF
jgi:WD40 repeat protein